MPEIREQLTLYDNFSRTLNNYIQMMEACQTSTANLATLSQNAARQVTVLMSSYRMAASQMNTNTSEINQQAAANRQLGQSHRETDAATRAQITAMDQQIVTINRQIAEINQQVAASRLLEQSHRETEAAIRAQTATIDQQIVTINRQNAEINQQVAASRLSEQSHRESEAAIRAQTSAIDQQIVTINRQIAEINQQAAASRAADAANRARLSQLRLEEAQVRRNTSAVDGLVSGLQNLAGAYLGVQGIQMLASASDNLVSTNARLQLMTGSAEEAKQLQDMIYQSAQRSRGLYTETASFVAKLGTLAGDAFGDTNELVGFAEQINKQMVLSGTSTAEASGAMLQLTQALASGTLRGEELNSVMEQTPMIAQTIAQYMGVSTGELRNLASEGLVSSEIVKNAVLSASDEVNQKFEQMPMTWGQVWNQMQNTALNTLQPVLIGVNLLANNMDVLVPIVLGVGGAFVVFQVATHWTTLAAGAAGIYHGVINFLSIGFGVLTGNTAAASAATFQFNSALMANPITWVVMGIILLVGALYAGVAAYNKFTDSSVSATGIITGAMFVLASYALNNTVVPIQRGFASLANFLGNVFNDPATAIKVLFYDVAITILGYIRSAANGIESMVNAFTGITGIEVNLTSGINDLYNDLQKNRAAAIEAGSYKEFIKPMEYFDLTGAFSTGYDFGKNLAGNVSDFAGNLFSGFEIPNYDEIANTLGGISDSVASIDKSVSMSEEDIRSLVDQAERRYVANVNLTSKSPVINVYGQNTGNTESDRRMIADVLRDVLLEQVSADSVVATAIV